MRVELKGRRGVGKRYPLHMNRNFDPKKVDSHQFGELKARRDKSWDNLSQLLFSADDSGPEQLAFIRRTCAECFQLEHHRHQVALCEIVALPEEREQIGLFRHEMLFEHRHKSLSDGTSLYAHELQSRILAKERDNKA